MNPTGLEVFLTTPKGDFSGEIGSKSGENLENGSGNAFSAAFDEAARSADAAAGRQSGPAKPASGKAGSATARAPEKVPEKAPENVPEKAPEVANLDPSGDLQETSEAASSEDVNTTNGKETGKTLPATGSDLPAETSEMDTASAADAATQGDDLVAALSPLRLSQAVHKAVVDQASGTLAAQAASPTSSVLGQSPAPVATARDTRTGGHPLAAQGEATLNAGLNPTAKGLPGAGELPTDPQLLPQLPRGAQGEATRQPPLAVTAAQTLSKPGEVPEGAGQTRATPVAPNLQGGAAPTSVLNTDNSGNVAASGTRSTAGLSQQPLTQSAGAPAEADLPAGQVVARGDALLGSDGRGANALSPSGPRAPQAGLNSADADTANAGAAENVSRQDSKNANGGGTASASASERLARFAAELRSSQTVATPNSTRSADPNAVVPASDRALAALRESQVRGVESSRSGDTTRPAVMASQQTPQSASLTGQGAEGMRRGISSGEPLTLNMALNTAEAGIDDALLVQSRIGRDGGELNASTRGGETPVSSPVAINHSPSGLARGADTVAQQTQILPDLTEAPDSGDFPEAMMGRIRLLQTRGGQEARLNLHPAELGRLQISISTEGDSARVAFTVENPMARDALEQAMPRLRELLNQAGLQLADSSVTEQGQGGFTEPEDRLEQSGMTAARDTDIDDGEVSESRPRGADPDRAIDAYA